jgi:GTP cyclohydrolase II
MVRKNGSTLGTGGINGDAALLHLDRAVGELRRGRAIAVSDGELSLVVAALETMQPGQLARLTAGSTATVLLLTPERAEAAGLPIAGLGAVALAVDGQTGLDSLRASAGIGDPAAEPRPEIQSSPWQGSPALTAAGFRLAKAGRLVPALVGFERNRLDDPTILEVPLAEVERQAAEVPNSLRLTSESRVPLADAENSRLALFRDEQGGGEHVAVVIGDPDPTGIVPVRLHSACLTGDLFGSLRCDCGEQLRTAVRRIAELGGGVLLYLDQEGRGIGLANKLRAYAIQDTGLDTLDADRHLGFSADERTYDVAAALLQELGISRIRLLTNNPQKIAALRDHGIDVVGRLPLIAKVNLHNERYLRAKRERAGHLAEDTGS